MCPPDAVLAGASAQININSRMNEVTDESSDSESEELSDYMSDEENTTKSGSDEENMKDSNLINAIRVTQKFRISWIHQKRAWFSFVTWMTSH